MRIIGIDYGDSRTGVAVSDLLGWTAQPVETIDMRKGEERAIERLREIIRQYEASKVVCGFPLNMNGTVGPRGTQTLAFLQRLSEGMENVEFIRWDERLTPVTANRTMHELGIKTKNKKGLVDRIAAVQLLQTYLDSQTK